MTRIFYLVVFPRQFVLHNNLPQFEQINGALLAVDALPAGLQQHSVGQSSLPVGIVGLNKSVIVVYVISQVRTKVSQFLTPPTT